MAEAKVMVKGDLEGQPTGTPVDLHTRVKLYAPKDAAHFSEGQETEVATSMVELFLSKGFTKQAPKAK